MRVYTDAYAATARHALAAHFPALAQVLGERSFAALAAAYLVAHPSRSHDYVAFGAFLPDFVRTFPLGCDGVAAEAVAELAALEQAQLEVQEAADDATRVTPETLLLLSPDEWEQARFGFAAACRLLRCTHDVLPALTAVTRGEPAPRPERGPTAYLVTRDAGRASVSRVDPAGADVLAALAAGAPFADACRIRASARAGDEAAGVDAGMAALVLACARGALRELRVTRWGSADIGDACIGGPKPCRADHLTDRSAPIAARS
jgi:hypothetical protein